MFNTSIRNIVTALLMSAALIGFAFYQRYGTPIDRSAVMFYLFAAIICVPRIVYGVLRCKSSGGSRTVPGTPGSHPSVGR
jgi:hypothetical protein